VVLDAERWAEARRLCRIEGYSVRKAARRLGLDPKTVRRALRQASYPGVKPRARRGSILDPHRALVRSLVTNDDLSATQIHQRLAQQHGFTGHISLVRRFVHVLRVEDAEAFLKLTFIPAECAQVDWGHYGRIMDRRSPRRGSSSNA
jgi:transposase